MELNDFDKSRTRFHLGFNAGAQIPAGDRARLEEAMALVPDEYWFNKIQEHLNRCDTAFDVAPLIGGTPGDRNYNPSRIETITGDVLRQINTTDPLKGDEFFWEIYLREVDRLAETLYVPNYRRPEVRRYAFERSGSEFIMAVPGPADTAVGSRIFFAYNWR